MCVQMDCRPVLADFDAEYGSPAWGLSWEEAHDVIADYEAEISAKISRRPRRRRGISLDVLRDMLDSARCALRHEDWEPAVREAFWELQGLLLSLFRMTSGEPLEFGIIARCETFDEFGVPRRPDVLDVALPLELSLTHTLTAAPAAP